MINRCEKSDLLIILVLLAVFLVEQPNYTQKLNFYLFSLKTFSTIRKDLRDNASSSETDAIYS